MPRKRKGCKMTQSMAETEVRPAAPLTENEKRLYAQIPTEIDFIPHTDFFSASAEAGFFGPNAKDIAIPRWNSSRNHDGEEAAMIAGSSRKLAAKDEEVLFLRYNYARYRLGKLLTAQNRCHSMRHARQMILWHGRVLALQGDIVEANMGLVLAMVKRGHITNVEFEELVSDGHLTLLRAVDKFDVSRGFKFSTYACRAILSGFSRLAKKVSRNHFPDVGFACRLMEKDLREWREKTAKPEGVLHILRQAILGNVAGLDPTDALILRERFGFTAEDGVGKTLSAVGIATGLTKERVRQRQDNALTQLRGHIERIMGNY